MFTIIPTMPIIGSVGLDEGLPAYTTVSGAAIKRCYCHRRCCIRVTVKDDKGYESKLRDIGDLQTRVRASHFILLLYVLIILITCFIRYAII